MERLTAILRFQAVVFVVYGLAFSLAPDFTLDTIFGWEGAATFFARMVGATFLALGWFDWLVANRLDSRMEMVWPLVLAPALLLAVLVGQRLAGNYEGSEAFYWVSVGVTAFFVASVGELRVLAERSSAAAASTAGTRPM